MIQRQHRFRIIAFFAFLLVVDWFLYFRHAGHFFQGDTVFLLNHRAESVTEFLKEFIQLNPSGWYRPLANELFESLLYPLAGLHPVPYRIPVYLVFIAITAGVFALVLALTRRHLTAALATFFFTIHTTNAYTTYDLGFMPELLYAFFYIAAALAYFRYLENASKTAYRLSLVFFIGSLLSKEAAVTLPATLFLLSVCFAEGPARERIVPAIRSVVPHMLVMVVYLGFALGYLRIQGFSVSTFFDPSQVPNEGDYIPVLNTGVFRNADLALTWAFNIPRGSWGQWRALEPWMLTYLKFVRVLFFALMVVMLFTPERRKVLFGSVWFWLTLLPVLPLVSHFVPYYLFLPVIGGSLVAGIVFAWLYDRLHAIQPLLATTAIVLICGGVLYVTSHSIQADIESSHLLGGAATLAENTLNDLKARYPDLPADATVYFADADQSLAWVHDNGGLIRMAYGKNSLPVLYQSQGDLLLADTQNAVVFEVHEGRLVDETARYRTKPAQYMKFYESEFRLALSVTEVTAGRDTYALTINPLRNTAVQIAYTLNDGPLEIFTAGLDADGKVMLDVSHNTARGVYRFWGFRPPGERSWFRAEQTLRVH